VGLDAAAIHMPKWARGVNMATVKVVADVCDTDHDGRISYAELEALGTVLRETQQLKKDLGMQ
jgi:hypothetical protein